MTNRVGEDYDRRNLDFRTPKIAEVLPEYFRSDYPKLIALLEAYHDYMDSDGNVNDDIRQLLKVRDVDGISLRFLEYLIQEVGDGITIDKFENPREVVRNFPDFYRLKGSLFSAKSFFRALYGEEVEISYPKDNVFIVGESLCGAESLRYIQNGALYQTLSVLVKSSRPISKWRDLYKRYVHPAGFYLGGEVIAEGIVDLALNLMPDGIPDVSANALQIFGVATIEPSADGNITGFYLNPDEFTIGTVVFRTSDGGLYLTSDGSPILPGAPSLVLSNYHVDLNRDFTAIWDDSVGGIVAQYGSYYNLATINTVGMDDSNGGITFDNVFETMDRSVHDSADTNSWLS